VESGQKQILEIGTEDGLIASFAPGAGMVCCSLTHRGEQVLGLRGGLDAYVEKRSTMGIPLLHPWANRLDRERFEVAGREIDVSSSEPPPKLDGNGLPIHGLLTAAPGWEPAEHARSDRIEARFRFAGSVARGFPFPHAVTLAATVSGSRLGIELTVVADAGSEVPIAFGFHPYFAVPGIPRNEWVLEAQVETGLEMDDRGIPTGTRVPVEPIEGPLGNRAFDNAFLAPPADEPFRLSGGGRSIEVQFEQGFPFAQLYAPPGEELLAWEPMTAPTNALVSGDGLTVIGPGESYRASFAVSVAAD
jgi:aldose 1-epimerase